MKRQECLLNLTLVVIIGALVFLIYDSRQAPESLSDLSVAPVASVPAEAEDEAADANSDSEDAETTPTDTSKFGDTKLFRALLTPTPTPTPTPPPPPPTPDIGKTLGNWKLLSVYEGKAMLEDVQKTAKQEEGAIWEMTLGQTQQVDVGSGIMKTATLKVIDDKTNPYNPEVTFGLEGTTAERKINLDTEPAAAAPAPAPAPQ